MYSGSIRRVKKNKYMWDLLYAHYFVADHLQLVGIPGYSCLGNPLMYLPPAHVNHQYPWVESYLV